MYMFTSLGPEYSGPANVCANSCTGGRSACPGVVLHVCDDPGLVRILSQKAWSGISVRIVFDEGQVREPSCSNQLARMKELLEGGAELYRLRVGTGFAILHDKLWVVDGRWVFTGSLNPTSNGFLNNSENLVEIDIPGVAIDAMSRIDSLLSRAEPVTNEYLDERLREQSERGRSGSTRQRR